MQFGTHNISICLLTEMTDYHKSDSCRCAHWGCRTAAGAGPLGEGTRQLHASSSKVVAPIREQKAIYVHVRSGKRKRVTYRTPKGAQRLQTVGQHVKSWRHVQEGSMAPRKSTSLPEEEKKRKESFSIPDTEKGLEAPDSWSPIQKTEVPSPELACRLA